MPNTYSQIYLHVVFSVRGRQSLIQPNWRAELHKYICGIIKAKEQKAYAIGGVADHIHIQVSIKPDVTISDLVRDIKSNSTKWINEKRFVNGKFQWQNGFGAFSCSPSKLNASISYINNQEQHHGKKSFETEYIELLRNYNIDFDNKYLFDWVL